MNYTIKDDVIVFHCLVNSELTKEHIEKISKYKILIFSNNLNIDEVIREYYINTNIYNEPLNNLPQSLNNIYLCYTFNKIINNLPHNH